MIVMAPSRLLLAGVLLVVSARGARGAGNDTDFTCDGQPIIFVAPDVLTADEILLTIPGLTRFVPAQDQWCDLARIDGDNVILQHNLSQYCEGAWRCDFECQPSPGFIPYISGLKVTINRTLTYQAVFSPESYNATLKETAAIGTKVLDQPLNLHYPECKHGTFQSESTKVYRIINSTGEFDWNRNSADALRVATKLDYDTKNIYHLQVKYTMTKLRLSATATITVKVQDVDNKNPTFNSTSYTLHIQEKNSSLKNVPLVTTPPVYAYDRDFGINSTIKYSISRQDEQGLFTIDNSTGTVAVTRVLDREKKAKYTLQIQAVEADRSTAIATSTLIVTVDDIDDNKPIFKPTVYTAIITEHSALGTVVTMVTAHDADEGHNALFEYTLFDTGGPLEIDKIYGTIRVKDPAGLDRENQPVITLTVGTIPLSGGSGENNATVTVTLADLNDNNPKFTEPSYTFNVTTPIKDKLIGQVNATDPDSGANGDITYAMMATGDPTSLQFRVDSVRGDIYVTSDHVTCSHCRLFVTACDNPGTTTGNRRCSSVDVTITVSASSTPLQNMTQTMSVRENLPSGTLLKQIQCAAPERTYTITGGLGKFNVDTRGILVINGSLDREETASFNLTVNVNDKSQTACRVRVHVLVLDTNDNAPNFTDLSNEYVFTLPEVVVAGVYVGSVQAIDLDEGENGRIQYRFLNPSIQFGLNASGGIYIRNASSLHDTDVMELYVIARDNGSVPLETIQTVYITRRAAVSIRAPMVKRDIEKIRGHLEKQLSSILGTAITIVGVHGSTVHVAEPQVEISAAQITRRDLLSRVVQQYERIRSLFFKSRDQDVDDETTSSALRAPEIALIVMAAIIVIASIVAIVTIRRQFNNHQRYKQLYESLTRSSSIYESQELKVKMDDETSDYNGSVHIQDLSDINPDLTPGVAVATVNPAFEDDEDEQKPAVPAYENNAADKSVETDLGGDPTSTSVGDVIESLDELSDRLEEEESSPPIVYANVNIGASEQDLTVEFIENKHEATNSAENELATDNTTPIPTSFKDVTDETMDSPSDPDIDEEPNPDYDLKQVRFSTEVLNADENVLKPLKEEKKTTTQEPVLDNETVISNDDNTPDTTDDTCATRDGNLEEAESNSMPKNNKVDNIVIVEDNTGWMEEEINSPVNVVAETDNENGDFYFAEDAMTYL